MHPQRPNAANLVFLPLAAHTIRNPISKVCVAATAIQAPCRWCLTGTPIQNSVDDYGALLSFIGVPPFYTYKAFTYWISDPIKKKKDFAFKRQRLLVQATCLRRTKANTGNSLSLPKKDEVNQVLELAPAERELYEFFKRRAATVARRLASLRSSKGNNSRKPKQSDGNSSESNAILPLIGNLRAICGHGEDLLPTATLQAWRNRDVDAIDWQLTTMVSQKCSACERELAESDDGGPFQELACGHTICTGCRSSEDEEGMTSPGKSCPRCSGRSPLPALSQESTAPQYKPWIKIEALLQNLRREHSTPSPSQEEKNPSKRY